MPQILVTAVAKPLALRITINGVAIDKPMTPQTMRSLAKLMYERADEEESHENNC